MVTQKKFAQPNLICCECETDMLSNYESLPCYDVNFKVCLGESCFIRHLHRIIGTQAPSRRGMFRKTTSQSEQRKTWPRLHVLTGWVWQGWKDAPGSP